jgi:hypothetical protein
MKILMSENTQKGAFWPLFKGNIIRKAIGVEE